MKFGVGNNPTDVVLDLVERFKKVRKEVGLSQVDLAARSGVSLGSLKRFERTGQISMLSLLLLVDVLGRLDDFELLLKPTDNQDAIEKLFSDKTRRL